MINEELREVAYQYGEAVAWREYYADEGGPDFDEYDARCRHLWKHLIALGAYIDAEHSELKPEVRTHYHRGLESVPAREIDWEEYWENMENEFGGDDDH